jgi:hypothetical protein
MSLQIDVFVQRELSRMASFGPGDVRFTVACFPGNASEAAFAAAV